MNLIYKKATANDTALIAQLAKSIWHKHYITVISIDQINYMLDKFYSTESLLQQMKEGQEFTLAYLNEKPVGYIAISSKNKKNYFLHKFYVEVDEHNKGIGSQLFEYILQQLQTLETIELYVNRENYKAINFYFKHQFKISQVVNIDIGNGFFMNDFLMLKKL